VNPRPLTRIVNQNRQANQLKPLGRLQFHLHRHQKAQKETTTNAYHDDKHPYHVGTLTKFTATLD